MSDKLQVTYPAAQSDVLKPALPDAKDRAEHTDRRIEKSTISSGGASVAVRNGSIELSANNNTHITIGENGTIDENSMQHVVTTNRADLNVDEITINKHVLNNRMYELTDFKQVTTETFQQGIVGNFCVLGTVLVKAWEPDLKRYVFIRRLCRMPMFSPAVAPVGIKSGVGITDKTADAVEIKAVMDKGNQNGDPAADQVKKADDTSKEKLASNEASKQSNSTGDA